MIGDIVRERYINPYTDFGFKKLFGTAMNKELLISFLNALFSGREVVRDITYLNSEQLGSLELDRKAVFDVYCENECGEKFLVEMQKGNRNFSKTAAFTTLHSLSGSKQGAELGITSLKPYIRWAFLISLSPTRAKATSSMK